MFKMSTEREPPPVCTPPISKPVPALMLDAFQRRDGSPLGPGFLGQNALKIRSTCQPDEGVQLPALPIQIGTSAARRHDTND
jgi:hypothetical protein